MHDGPEVSVAQPSGSVGVPALMGRLKSDLAQLIAIPSISAVGYAEPRQPLLDAYELVARLFREAGVQGVTALALHGTAPVLTGEIPAPEGAPTVLLYSHYDVVAAGDESLWTSPAFEPTERDGALFGRGSADSKADIIAHIGALRAWNGRPPVGIKLVIEGQEEVGGGALTTYPLAHPVAFACDAMVIRDMGSVGPGAPTLTVDLHGMAMVEIEVTTLGSAKHSGQFGGAAPDALTTLLHALSTLHEERGDVALPGLRCEGWTGECYSDEEYRELAEVRDGLPLLGTGGRGSRIWSGPAITVTGIDVPPVENALNAISPWARAKLNLRVHPEQNAVEAQAALVAHLKALRPFGIALKVTSQETGNGFSSETSGPAYAAARAAMTTVWGQAAVNAADGASIPLVNALHTAVPEAEILLVGATDGYANIHAPDERVLLDEFEHAVAFEAAFFGEFATRWRANHD
jgi:acetylornithine deacetylase/succinyl-diaminopimelate desuccinylase-like protein